MSKFKVGDKVRICYVPKEKGTRYLLGKIGVIDRVGKNMGGQIGYHVDIISNPYILCFDDELELVKPKFDIKDYPGKYVMHVTSVEQAKIFCEYLHSIGRKWNGGNSYLYRTNYHYGTRTCYEFNANKYDEIKWFEECNYTILEFDDFDWRGFMKKEFNKADLKNGDVVKRRDGSVEILVSDLNVFVGDDGDYAELCCINDDLTSNCSTDRDIIAVRRINCNYGNPFQTFQHEYGTLVYERKEVEEMTLEEVCKALGKEIKIVKK